MVLDNYTVNLVLVLTIGFGLSSILGYLTFRAGLSPILGYLIAGFIIGPYSPGIVIDLKVTEELAEIGVILMMFGVGLHFKWEDLMGVRKIAVPGAILQMVIATAATVWFLQWIGWSVQSGVIIGLSVGVASTIVLLRVFIDNQQLNTIQGHISVGWLIVEDLLTIIVLILLPILGEVFNGADFSYKIVLELLFEVAIKIILLFGIVFTLGQKAVSKILEFISKTQSQELFTIAILALTFMIATGSAIIFGASFALGAFLAGMIIGRTEVRHEAAINSLPMRDAFAVLFFLSIGMLFNPRPILDHWAIFLALMAVIMVIKPLATFVILKIWKYPTAVAVSVALAIAQIGEFSFILSEQALNLKLIPDEGFDLIVAGALISISLNPIIFKLGLQFDNQETV